MMKLVVLVTLVSMAMGRPPPCEDYCRTMWYTTQLPPPWDPSCDCAQRKIPLETVNGKPVYTATTIFKMDDTGIYFEPTTVHEDGISTVKNKPFYIGNSLEEFLTKPPISANHKAAAGIPVRQQYPDLKTAKYKGKNSASFGEPTSYKSFSYISRNDEFPKPKNYYENIDQGSIGDAHQMGKSFSKCVDLYLMAVARIHNNGTELAKMWSKSKYRKFSKLSNTDLMVTMRQECDETQDFLKKSVEKLMDKQPKKKSNNDDAAKTKQNKPKEPNNTAKATDDGVDKFKTSGLLGSVENNPFPVPPIDTSDKSTVLPAVSGLTTTPAQGATNLDTKMASPIPEPFETLTPNNNMDTPSMNNDMHETKTPQWIPLYDLKTAIEGDDAEEADDEKFAYSPFEKYPNSTIASQSKNGILAAPATYPKDRPRYNENEAPPQKLITREFAEGLIGSAINGTEDFDGDYAIDEDEGGPENPDFSVTGGPGDTVQVEMGHQQIPLFIGNLYFRFDEKYVPAKFVQKSDGKVHVAIDGATICAKINLERDHESPALSGFCEKFPNNPNN